MPTTQDREHAKTSTRDLGEVRQRLTAWMAKTLVAGAEPRLSEVRRPGGSGMSSETLLFDMTWNENGVERSGAFVGRMPPASDAYPTFPKYDLDLQANVMRLVGERSAVKVPRVVWSESSREPLGMPFFIMERIEGIPLEDNPPYLFTGWLREASFEDQAKLQRQAIAAIAGLHGIKVSGAEFEFLQLTFPGETPMRRLMARSKDYYDWARGDLQVPLIEQLMAWLEENWPENDGQDDPVIYWGDARLGNMLWKDFEVQAVLDWESASVGPRELDVAWMIYFHKYFQAIAAMRNIPEVPMADFLRRDDVVATYEELTNYKIRDINWYLAFSLMLMSIIEVRIAGRQLLFGEITKDSDPNNYLRSRELIRGVLQGQDVWA